MALIHLLLLLSMPIPADQSLREAARESGGSASNTIDYTEPTTTIAQLVQLSDFIVHARVLSSKTLLVHDESLVATDYTISPLAVIKQAPSLATMSRPGSPATNAVIRRIGGTVIEGGYRYSTLNGSIPEDEAPRVGDEVIWFLRYQPTEKVFGFTAGPFAAFRVNGGEVRALTTAVATRRGDGTIDISTFIRAIRQPAVVK